MNNSLYTQSLLKAYDIHQRTIILYIMPACSQLNHGEKPRFL